MIHTNLPPINSHKWSTVLVDEVKGKPCNFEACLCGSLYSTFTTPFYPYASYNKRLQTLFKDQLDRSFKWRRHLEMATSPRNDTIVTFSFTYLLT